MSATDSARTAEGLLSEAILGLSAFVLSLEEADAKAAQIAGNPLAEATEVLAGVAQVVGSDQARELSGECQAIAASVDDMQSMIRSVGQAAVQAVERVRHVAQETADLANRLSG